MRGMPSHRRALVVCLLAVLALFAGVGLLGRADAAEGEPLPPEQETCDTNVSAVPDEGWYDPNVVLVGVSSADDADDVDEVLSELPEVETHEVSDEELESGVVAVELAEGVSVEEGIDALAQTGAFDIVQPSFRYVVMDDVAGDAEDGQKDSALAEAASPDDPLAASQQHLAQIAAPEAWELAKAERDARGSAVGVAIVDVGFDATHEDLVGTVAACYDAVEEDDTVNNDGAGVGHGTHVAGILAAQTDNGVGVSGASYNAQLVLIRVADDEGIASSEVLLRAYDYAIDHAKELNIRVVNMSLGTVAPSGAMSASDKLLLNKIDEAYKQGIVTVAAAGNSSTAAVPYAEYPGDYERVVSVISVDSNDNRASSSNYNVPGESSKNICAPGTNILSTYRATSYVAIDGERVYGYSRQSGTSMATPSVSAVLALEFAANPELTAERAVSLLYASARDIGEAGWDEQTGYGEVDARAAVEVVLGIRDETEIDDTRGLTGWYSPDKGVTYYWYEKGTRRTKAGWLVTDKTPSGDKVGLQRYWIGKDGVLARDRLVDPAEGSGWWAYARDEGYVVRGSYATGSDVYLADNDGRLAPDGWVVSSAYGQGLQRYFVDPSTHSARVGYSADGWPHYTTSAGYVLRGTLRVGSVVYVADNDGLITDTIQLAS